MFINDQFTKGKILTICIMVHNLYDHYGNIPCFIPGSSVLLTDFCINVFFQEKL